MRTAAEPLSTDFLSERGTPTISRQTTQRGSCLPQLGQLIPALMLVAKSGLLVSMVEEEEGGGLGEEDDEEEEEAVVLAPAAARRAAAARSWAASEVSASQ